MIYMQYINTIRPHIVSVSKWVNSRKTSPLLKLRDRLAKQITKRDRAWLVARANKSNNHKARPVTPRQWLALLQPKY